MSVHIDNNNRSQIEEFTHEELIHVMAAITPVDFDSYSDIDMAKQHSRRATVKGLYNKYVVLRDKGLTSKEEDFMFKEVGESIQRMEYVPEEKDIYCNGKKINLFNFEPFPEKCDSEPDKNIPIFTLVTDEDKEIMNRYLAKIVLYGEKDSII